MENEMRKVNPNNEFILLINTKAYYGTVEDLEEVVIEHLDNGGEIEEVQLGEYNLLNDVEFKVEKKIDIEMDDNENSEEEKEFVLYNGSFREIDSYSNEDDALREITRLISEEGYGDDEVSLVRKVEFGCTYNVEQETNVKISIPPQQVPFVSVQTGGIDWDSKTSEYLYQELRKINAILEKRNGYYNQTIKPIAPEGI